MRRTVLGLATIHPGQPPQKLTPQLRAKVLEKTRQSPPDGSTHWSLRRMAAVMKVSKNLIARIWKEADLKPHRLEGYIASNDPQFAEKAAAIIGLYLNPPQNAAVFCVDEKSAIQALDRLDRRLRLSPGRAEKHGFESEAQDSSLHQALSEGSRTFSVEILGCSQTDSRVVAISQGQPTPMNTRDTDRQELRDSVQMCARTRCVRSRLALNRSATCAGPPATPLAIDPNATPTQL
ncbi:MAG TPA: hypothetical protein VGQ49_00755 [Bryobacteraceae bacterium]|jgi:hypothetical protein|nr:hypothetical protein [Bryobacteraceae bacterium]